MGKLSGLPPYTSPALTDALVGIESPGSSPTDVQIPIQDLLDLFGGGVWQSWTPTWTNWAIGNSIVVAKYTQIGKTVFWSLAVTLGTTASVSVSVPIFSLPVTAANTWANTNSVNIGMGGMALAAGDAVYFARAQVQSTTTAVVTCEFNTSNYISFGTITSSEPFSWTTNSVLDLKGSYQAA